jgi:hypothetical protein
MRRAGLVAASAILLYAIAAFLFDWPLPHSGQNRQNQLNLAPADPSTAPSAKPHRQFTPANSRAIDRSSAPGVLLLPDAQELSARLNAPEGSAEEDIEIVQSIVASFRTANGGLNPAGGLNEEIMDALRGNNPNRIAAFPPTHSAIDAQGRLLDRWSTPYFFHPISGKVLELRSAGPDRKHWTEDDVFDGTAAQGGQ